MSESHVAYHGSPEGVTRFTHRPGKGVYFSDSRDVAYSFAGDSERARVTRVRVAFNRPLVLDARGAAWGSIARIVPFDAAHLTTDTLASRLLEEGFDGAIIQNLVDIGARLDIPDALHRSTIFIATSPEQISYDEDAQ